MLFGLGRFPLVEGLLFAITGALPALLLEAPPVVGPLFAFEPPDFTSDTGDMLPAGATLLTGEAGILFGGGFKHKVFWVRKRTFIITIEDMTSFMIVVKRVILVTAT